MSALSDAVALYRRLAGEYEVAGMVETAARLHSLADDLALRLLVADSEGYAVLAEMLAGDPDEVSYRAAKRRRQPRMLRRDTT